MVKGGQICQVEQIIASIEYQEEQANKEAVNRAEGGKEEKNPCNRADY